MHVAVRWKVYINMVNELTGTDKWLVSDEVMTLCQPVGLCHYLYAIFIHIIVIVYNFIPKSLVNP